MISILKYIFFPVKAYLVQNGEATLTDTIPFEHYVECDGYKIYFDPLNYKLDDYNDSFEGIQIFGDAYVETDQFITLPIRIQTAKECST
jgi:hypothetical protein